LIHNQPYAKLAKIYDRVMNHVKYDKWADYILSIFRHFGVHGKSILEIACGTGNLSVFLLKHGYDITGMDLSPAMLKIAADKFKENGIPQKLVAANMTSIPLKKKFDAVLCLYDSLNYIRDPADFKKAIEETSTVTKGGGLFIFDVCTLLNSQIFFSNKSMFEDLGDIKYERKCHYHESENIQENVFIIEHNGKRFVEKHLQRIYKLDEVRKIISNSSFKMRGMFNDLTFDQGTESSERVHFVLQKK